MNLFKIKNSENGEFKKKATRQEAVREDGVDEKALIHSDLLEDRLYCDDQPGSRLEPKARDSGKFFENLTWLTSNEATEYLRLPSVGMLRVLVCKRQIPFHKLGRRLRFRKIELDRLIETSRNGGR